PPGGCEDGVADRRCDERSGRLADAARWRIGRDLVSLDLRHFVHAHEAVVVEVALLHAPGLDVDLAPERRGEAEKYRALDLRGDDARIDGPAAVECADDLLDLDLAAGERDL